MGRVEGRGVGPQRVGATCERATRVANPPAAHRPRVARQSMLINFRLTVHCSTASLKSAERVVFHFILNTKGRSYMPNLILCLYHSGKYLSNKYLLHLTYTPNRPLNSLTIRSNTTGNIRLQSVAQIWLEGKLLTFNRVCS